MAASTTLVVAKSVEATAEAIVVDGAALAGLDGDGGSPLHQMAMALSRAGVDVVVLVDGGLGEEPGGPAGLAGARPEGPGRLVMVEDATAEGADRVLAELARRGIGPGLILLAGPAAIAGFGGRPGMERAARIDARGGDSVLALLGAQVARRAAARVPEVDEDPSWTLVIGDGDLGRRDLHVEESLLTIANGSFGARGAREGESEGRPLVFAAGVYDDREGNPLLLEAPIWTSLVTHGIRPDGERQVLDLRTGVLVRECAHEGGMLRTLRFLSLARPHAAVLRAEGPASAVQAGRDLQLPAHAPSFARGRDGERTWAWTRGAQGSGITVAARTVERRDGGRRVLDRLAAYLADPRRAPAEREALDALVELERVGFDRLLGEHRAAWAARWADAEVCIDGDADLELAARFALFHLIGSVPDSGEAPVGARGLSGGAYGGHVLWDADVYVLPALAATHPPAARAMLDYRVRRLDAARLLARARGHEGARFPWESGRDGVDITPNLVRASGQIVPILTGEHEEHIVADVAWAAWHYHEWTGDDAFLAGPGRALLTETARYWASRVRTDSAGAHIYGVVGPDEYREIVDDNAYTNVLARWNLRRAAALVERDGIGATPEEVARWRAVADALVDGYDPATGLYEQCAGFWGLDPIVIAEEYELPLMADERLGRARVMRSQVLKQPDVLMLHHLVPEEVAPSSLAANLDFYLPRTSHGSSLSPAIHAALLARAGRPDEALDLFRLAGRLDFDDRTGTTARGLHTATAGGVWQALAFGFAGVRPSGTDLGIDPHLPSSWRSVTVTVRFHGVRVQVQAGHDEIALRCDGDVRVTLAELGPVVVGAPGGRFRRRGAGWQPA